MLGKCNSWNFIPATLFIKRRWAGTLGVIFFYFFVLILPLKRTVLSTTRQRPSNSRLSVSITPKALFICDNKPPIVAYYSPSLKAILFQVIQSQPPSPYQPSSNKKNKVEAGVKNILWVHFPWQVHYFNILNQGPCVPAKGLNLFIEIRLKIKGVDGFMSSFLIRLLTLLFISL